MYKAKQLTLFDCAERSETEPSTPKRARIEFEPDSAALPAPTKVPACSDQQTNHITVNSPSGPTTVVVNASKPGPDSLNTLHNAVSDNSNPDCGDNTARSTSLYSELPDDIAPMPTFPPVQPTNVDFPVTYYSGKPRSFNPAWFKSYSWLEYSVKFNACFCYPCRLFGSECGFSTSRPEQTFTRTGFKDWKHATGKNGILSSHSNCHAHKEAVVAWKQYSLNSQKGTLISEQLGSARAEQIKQNRHYLKSVAEVVLLCSVQEIALRGHRESSASKNRGNFLEILQLLAHHDPVIEHRLSDGPRNAAYTSPDIQNTLLRIMGNTVRKHICLAVQKAGVFSILADESKDCSKREQMAIVVRYVDADSATVFERFLTYVEATSLDAESLSAYILDTLKQHNLDPENIVSQGYDGASVMSGHCAGVQQRIKEIAPHATYVHCYAHCLNLVLVDSTRNVSEASDFFALMETLYVFVSTSKAHTVYLEQQSQLHPDKQVRQLKRLSDTRWACRYQAVDAVCSTYDSILKTLEIFVEGDDRAKATEATGILLQVRSFKFVLCLVIFWRTLSCTKSLSDQLQSIQIDMAKAADLVSATIDTVKEFRSDTEWGKVFKYVQDVATLHHIDVSTSRPQRQRQVPRRLEDGFVLDTTGSRDVLSTSEQFKISVYFPILDAMLSELDHRFTDKNLELMRAIQACHPQSIHFLQQDKVLPLANSYSLNSDCLSMECSLVKRTLKNDIENISDLLLELRSLRSAFPTLIRLLQIALTVVVTTAHCERSFSALKRIKTYLRSTMTEQRLVDLAVLSIERDLSGLLSLDEIIDTFAGEDKNRRIALF